MLLKKVIEYTILLGGKNIQKPYKNIIMEKEAQVVMLPTEDKTDILLNIYINETHKSNSFCIGTTGDILKELPVEAIERRGYKYQHLYIIDDSKIKSGDWCLFFWDGMKDGEIRQVGSEPQRYFPENGHTLNRNLRKIIATTDPELNVIYTNEEPPTNPVAHFNYNVPQIPQSLIESYCKNPVDKVMIEYTLPDKIKNALIMGNLSRAQDSDYILKVDSHNEIIISVIEEKLYTREEMIEAFGSGVSGIPRAKWIKENL